MRKEWGKALPARSPPDYDYMRIDLDESKPNGCKYMGIWIA